MVSAYEKQDGEGRFTKDRLMNERNKGARRKAKTLGRREMVDGEKTYEGKTLRNEMAYQRKAYTGKDEEESEGKRRQF